MENQTPPTTSTQPQSVVNQVPTQNPIKYSRKSRKWIIIGILVIIICGLILFLGNQVFIYWRPATETIPARTRDLIYGKGACGATCNYSVYPARECNPGLKCITSSKLLGASGICRNPQCIESDNCQCQ